MTTPNPITNLLLSIINSKIDRTKPKMIICIPITLSRFLFIFNTLVIDKFYRTDILLLMPISTNGFLYTIPSD